ncbi:formate hydrogenlyase transcriptional activator [Silvibacterium bohemicum]|uniref:Formate hydrogenlyase transcriptional activator n=1 Tax=Silvibacterium bohemicum TaxID=1577686 RepID=A0A841JPC1_9BACT|nr:sigma-54-dependent Fis family transcriptional regulator [Silvibacterium bohemicum]MBB6143196.1 formate hydrogenlyase transcriptional activator [Silvibacterium bohemicum]
MTSSPQLAAHMVLSAKNGQNRSGLLSSDAVLNILRMIFAGAPLAEVLTIIAQLVESRGDGTLCSVWLPTDDGRELYCVAAPSIPGFVDGAGSMLIGPKGGACGTAVYRREPVYVTDILTDPVWDVYRHRLLPFGIRAVWSHPLFTSDGEVLGTFAIHYREARSPDAVDLESIENFSHIAGIAIERHRSEEKLRHERDRLRLLLEITSSVTSRLDLRQVVDALSTNLFSIMQCDVSALLLPDSESGELRVTTLYNPEGRGPFREGSLVSMKSSISGQVLRSGKSIRIDSFEQVREDPEIYGSPEGQLIYERVMEEGLNVGCYLPLAGRDRVVGVLMLARRSNNAFEKEDVILLEQVARQIATAVENTLEYEKATKDRDKETKQRLYLEEEIRAEFGEIVGESSALNSALHLVSVVAPTDSSVIIQGETGTGKELIARAIHNLSSRRERAFVKLNCAAIPLGLLESELFGHEKGAFTGAVAQKTGRFELAHKGTLFLDEVGDIPLELQAKLLRVLQEQEFERLGSNRTHKVDVRLIAATHRDLAAMVKEATFREDLYYRLKVFPISIPALRQRTEDIPKLVSHFTKLYARRMNKRIEAIPSETMDALVRYRWPGNVRELQNFIERAVILSPHTVLRAPTSELEPFHVHRNPNMVMTGLEEVERDHILHALEVSNWVVGGRNGAAERLGMKRTSLVYRMRKLRIIRPVSSPEESRAHRA